MPAHPEEKDRPIEEDLPLVYRLILKLPNLSLGGFSDRFKGYFWMIVVPVFTYCNYIVSLLVFVEIPVPFNVIIAVLYNATVALLLIRILIQRELDTRKAILEQAKGLRWDVERASEEYKDMVEKRKRKS